MPTRSLTRPRLLYADRATAWSRRYLQMSKGVLSYYKKPGAYCRGTIDISTATVTVILRTRQIVIDSGLVLFHLRGAFDLAQKAAGALALARSNRP